MAEKKSIFIYVDVDVRKATKEFERLVNEERKLKQEQVVLRRDLKKLTKLGRDTGRVYKGLNQTYAQNRIRVKALSSAIREQSNSLSGLTKNATRFRDKMSGAMTTALKSVALQFLAITAAIRVLGDAFGIVKDFDKGVADLASVMGKTRKEMGKLTKSAKILGSTTAFTASQVVSLQKELAKLGFTEVEIISSTKAIIDLSVATGTDLKRATEVAGTTLRAFGLDANEMTRVVDVMTKGFSSSALDMEKFAESMKNVAPAAKATGVSVETTTALLGTLANVGISGSLAGTQLRRIFSEMGTEGSKLSNDLGFVVKSSEDMTLAFEVLASKGLDLGKANELVGRRAKGALLALTDLNAITISLEIAMNKAAGTAEAMAETQLESLAGKTTLLKSAWEGFVLSIENGEGLLAGAFGSTLEFLTDTLRTFQGIESVLNQIGVAEAGEEWANYGSELKRVDLLMSQAGNNVGDVSDAIAVLDDQLIDYKQTIKELKANQKELGDTTIKGGVEAGFTAYVKEVRAAGVELDDFRESYETYLNTLTVQISKYEELEKRITGEIEKRDVALRTLELEKKTREQLNAIVISGAQDGATVDEVDDAIIAGNILKKLTAEKLEGIVEITDAQILATAAARARAEAEIELANIVVTPTVAPAAQSATAGPLAAQGTDGQVTGGSFIILENFRVAIAQLQELRDQDVISEAEYRNKLFDLSIQAGSQKLAEQERIQGAFDNLQFMRENDLINEQEYQDELARIKEQAIAQDVEIKEKKEEIDEQVNINLRANLALSANIAGQAASLAEKGSDAHKALAITQALINTYLAASAAFASAAGNPIAGAVLASIAVAGGLAMVAKIRSFDEGGPVKLGESGYTGPGAKHESKGLIEVHGDEYVLNKADVKKLGGWRAIEAMLDGHETNTTGAYVTGGIVRQTIDTTSSDTARQFSQLQSEFKNQQIVAIVEDINEGQTRVNIVEDRASA